MENQLQVGALLMNVRLASSGAYFQWMGRHLYNGVVIMVESAGSAQHGVIVVPIEKPDSQGAIRIDDKLGDFLGESKPSVMIRVTAVAGINNDNKQSLIRDLQSDQNSYRSEMPAYMIGVRNAPQTEIPKPDPVRSVSPVVSSGNTDVQMDEPIRSTKRTQLAQPITPTQPTQSSQEIETALPKTNGHIPAVNGNHSGNGNGNGNGHSFRHWVEDCVKTVKSGGMRMTLVVLLKILPVTTRNGYHNNKRLPAFVSNCGENFQTTLKTYGDRTSNCVKSIKSPKRPKRKPSDCVTKLIRKPSTSRPRKKLEGKVEKTETRVLYERRKRIKAILGL